ncbi:MAG: hypothetical protein KC493_16210 [Bacteriovoracaceae bacterium]|nr:hypothetical protein [Bacteriovoracaceae bacterium]
MRYTILTLILILNVNVLKAESIVPAFKIREKLMFPVKAGKKLRSVFTQNNKACKKSCFINSQELKKIDATLLNIDMAKTHNVLNLNSRKIYAMKIREYYLVKNELSQKFDIYAVLEESNENHHENQVLIIPRNFTSISKLTFRHLGDEYVKNKLKSLLKNKNLTGLELIKRVSGNYYLQLKIGANKALIKFSPKRNEIQNLVKKSDFSIEGVLVDKARGVETLLLNIAGQESSEWSTLKMD